MVTLTDDIKSVKTLTDLLLLAVQKEASDVHLVSGLPPVFRVDGRLIKMEAPVLTGEEVWTLVQEVLSEDRKKEFKVSKELDFAFSVGEHRRVRGNLHYEKGEVACALRLIPKVVPSFESLGLPKTVKEFTLLPRGLVLVTGPTGSGKSTTLASLIHIINHSRRSHIITVEDPIEYLHEHGDSIVEQREVGEDTRSFSESLRRVLRQDPDVILVGEMRDLDTISTAVTAAETGHLVFSTLHTNDAVQTVDRLVDVFPPHQQQQIRIQLSMTLCGVVAQQLLPRIDGPGRVVACEILVVNSAVRNLIRKGQSAEIASMIEIGGKFGMQTMDSALATLYKLRKISMEEALSRAVNQEQLKQLIH